MQKWEYFKVDAEYSSESVHNRTIKAFTVNGVQTFNIADIVTLRKYLNGLGKEGWEVISVTATGKGESYLLKRPIE